MIVNSLLETADLGIQVVFLCIRCAYIYSLSHIAHHKLNVQPVNIH